MIAATVIIPTYNRPRELERCLRSILKQTRLPKQLIVVDDGALPNPPLEHEIDEARIEYLFLHKTPPGLPESRNIGSQKASGEIVFFFDDDVVLEPEYIDEVLAIYEADTAEEVGGIGGVDTALPISSGIKLKALRLFQRIFLLSGGCEGRILSSGFYTEDGSRRKVARWPDSSEVDFLPGCACSFRRHVVAEFPFRDRPYAGCYGEDKDMSYRVSRSYLLLIALKAKLWHEESPLMRADAFRQAQLFLSDRYLFFKDYLASSSWRWLLFYYAVSGYLLGLLVRVAVRPSRKRARRLAGAVKTVVDMVRGRIDQPGVD
jgi:GT2 family glycosyltransferase